MIWNGNRQRQEDFAVSRLSIGLGICLLMVAALPAEAADEKKPEIPKPENLTLETSDGLLLRCRYYYGGIDKEKKKQTVPVILVHGWDGSADQYDGLALRLQQLGHAVLVPNMRGHGGSVKFNDGRDDLDRDRMRRNELALMANDIEACKRYLMQQNNQGKLNIELLTVVAAGEMGAVTALNWVALDWSWPKFPGRKQGQDVKALVLLSPGQSFKGLTARKALMHDFIQNKSNIEPSTLFIVGANDRSSSTDTKRMYAALENNNKEKKTLFLINKETSLSGVKMLDRRLNLNTDITIAKFIQLRLVNRASEFPWTMRK